MRFTVRHAAYSVVLFAVLLAVWLLSSEPWGLGVFQLLVFTAPGALLGLGAAWMANATTQREWTWLRARNAALLGAGTLPPVLAFLIALDGNARPQRLLVGFVHAAWIALLAGGTLAVMRWHRQA